MGRAMPRHLVGKRWGWKSTAPERVGPRRAGSGGRARAPVTLRRTASASSRSGPDGDPARRAPGGPLVDGKRAQTLVTRTWDESIVPALTEYIRIPNQSPAFDAEWVA